MTLLSSLTPSLPSSLPLVKAPVTEVSQSVSLLHKNSGSYAKVLSILMGALATLTATFLQVWQEGFLSKKTLLLLAIQIMMLAMLIDTIGRTKMQIVSIRI